MKKVFVLLSLLFAFTLTFAAVPDSTAANLTGEVLGGLYNYFAPSLSSAIKQTIATIVTLTPVVLLALQIVFKKVPQLAPIEGWIGFILDSLTWYVKNTTTTDTDPSKKN